MDLLSDYYPYLYVKGKNVDAIFRDLCTNDVYRQIQDGTWKETLINRFGEMLTETPDVRTTVNRMLRDGMLKRGYDIDPEKVYYNIFSDYTSIGNNVYHAGNTLTSSYRLTDAALMNLFKKDYEGSFYILQSWKKTGIYNVGKEGSVDTKNPNLGRCWGPHNAAFLSFEPADILDKSAGVQSEFTKEYKAYWSKYSDLYCDMLSDFFLLAAISQYKAGLLSEYGFSMMRKVYAKQSGVSTYWFNINSYKANDIIVIESQASGIKHTVLYIPGSSVPFMEFDNLSNLKTWIVNQLADSIAMKAFLKHFSIYNRQDGPSYTGVDNIVKKMVEGDSDWNPQYYILKNPEKIPYDAVFSKMRDQIKAAMHDDAQKLVTTDGEIYRDYVLGFIETILVYTSFLDIIVPKIAIPYNIVLSLTALGLSSDIVINGDTLEKRMDGVGSLVNSSVNIAFNMIPIFKDAGKALKSFKRVASDIPVFAREEQFMLKMFNIDSEITLNKILPGDPPIIAVHETGELRLVRLADGGEPLAVLRKVSGNKFIRVNPMTLNELEGERLISEVLINDVSQRVVYISGSKLLGGAPYNPYEFFFDEIWTLNEFKRRADKLGLDDSQYAAIKRKLRELHIAIEFDTKQQAAHELFYLLKEYKQTYPLSRRNPVINELMVQIKELLYPAEIRFLGRKFIESETGMHPLVASRLYKVSQTERLGEISGGITLGLMKYAQQDPVLSVTKLSQQAQITIQADVDFTVKYVIQDMSVVNKLSENFASLPEYASVGLTHNIDVFNYALKETQRKGLLSKWKVVNTPILSRASLIGHNYDEMLAMLNDFSSSSSTEFGIHPRTITKMLKALLKGGNEGQMMKQFGRKEYFDSLVKERLKNMGEIISLYDDTIFKRFDDQIQSVYESFFQSMPDESAILAKMMESPNGIILRREADEISFCLRNLDFFKNKGVTHIGFTCFFADVHQTELNAFMSGGFLTPAIEAVILTVDKGVDNGPLSQLLSSARSKGLKAQALGHSESALHSIVDALKNIYTKGSIVKNSGQFLKGHKFILFAEEWLINTSPGLTVPLPGLAQMLSAPGFSYQPRKRTIEFYRDLWKNRYPIYIEPDRGWLPLSPESGRFLGWKKYDENFQFPTPIQREESIFSTVTQNLEEFKKEYNEIREIASVHQCGRSRHCDKTSANVRSALLSAGKRVGAGVSLSWWQREGNDFINQVHTAPTVYIHETEFVVDATYLDITGEGVVILPVDNWVEEVFNKFKGYNPYLVYRTMLGGSLAGLVNPDFTRPRIRRINQ